MKLCLKKLIKPTMKYHYIPTRMAKIKIKPTLNANEATEKPDHSISTDENLKQHRCSDKQPLSLKTKIYRYNITQKSHYWVFILEK